jgi:hypothetical protein
MTDAEWMTYLLLKVEKGLLTEEEAETFSTRVTRPAMITPPQRIPLIQHLKDDIYALREFVQQTSPPEIQGRRQTVHVLLYGFADVSGGGLGSTVNVPGMGICC